MKLNKSFSKADQLQAITQILELTKAEMSPVLIVRDDDPEKILSVRNHFAKMENCIYVRLGVACNMGRLYEEIYLQLHGSEAELDSSYQERTLQLIVDKIKEKEEQYILVIDNCQHFVFKQIFMLLGLMLELDFWTQFIFLLPDEYARDWQKKKDRDRLADYFLSHIKHKYEFDGN